MYGTHCLKNKFPYLFLHFTVELRHAQNVLTPVLKTYGNIVMYYKKINNIYYSNNALQLYLQ